MVTYVVGGPGSGQAAVEAGEDAEEAWGFFYEAVEVERREQPGQSPAAGYQEVGPEGALEVAAMPVVAGENLFLPAAAGGSLRAALPPAESEIGAAGAEVPGDLPQAVAVED